MRANIAKGNRIADANEKFFEESVAEWEQAQQKPAEGRGKQKRSEPDQGP